MPKNAGTLGLKHAPSACTQLITPRHSKLRFRQLYDRHPRSVKASRPCECVCVCVCVCMHSFVTCFLQPLAACSLVMYTTALQKEMYLCVLHPLSVSRPPTTSGSLSANQKASVASRKGFLESIFSSLFTDFVFTTVQFPPPHWRAIVSKEPRIIRGPQNRLVQLFVCVCID